MTKQSTVSACTSGLEAPRIDWELFKEVRQDLLLFELNKMSKEFYKKGEQYEIRGAGFYKIENGQLKRYVEIKP